MSLLEHGPRTASVRTVRDSELLVIEPADFERLLERSPSTALTLLRTVLARLRSTEALLVQNGKLAALGTLAAGLAHELNNPASALLRGLSQLRGALREVERCTAELSRLGQWGTLQVRLERSGRGDSPAVPPVPLGLEALEAEETLLDWLEARGVERAVQVAQPLLTAGWTTEELRDLLDGLDARHLAPVLHWLAAHSLVATVVEEASHSAGAISDIVAAVKAHSALGQPSVREQDIVQGSESALVVLRARLRDGVAVVRDYDGGLPRVEAYGAELNHVWANLIENAVDAMRGRGTLELRAARADDRVVVRVSDDGPGIPDEVRARIFDPFFTSKPFGSGTGMGLHVAYTIVRRHGGSIEVDSRPGRTTFTVDLPLRLRNGG